MKTDAYVTVSAVIFMLVALMHLLRLLQGWPVMLGAMAIPVWVSVIALLVTAVVAIWGFSILRHH